MIKDKATLTALFDESLTAIEIADGDYVDDVMVSGCNC